MSKGISDWAGPRILSLPVPVEWASWRTDTCALQRTGWQLAVDYDPEYDRYRLLMKHPEMRLTAFTDSQHIERNHYSIQRDLPPFTVRHVAATIHVQTVIDDFSRFHEIDAEPRYMNHKITRLEDMNIFAMREKSTEVLIDQANMEVIDHLEAIKRLQAPKQSEIRERLLRARDSGARGSKHVIAELCTYAEAA